METIKWLLTVPMFRGFLTGIASAALVDYGAFRSWKNFHDMYTYDWGTALWRWLQGGIVGAVTGFGFGLTPSA